MNHADTASSEPPLPSAAGNGSTPQREAPTQHKFKVQMYDFSCEGLVQAEKCEPYLKINFDNFKIFKTDHETKGVDPEWGFRAGFQYVMHYLERLRDRQLMIQCINRTTGQVIGEASMDLQTIACGPAHLKLTLYDKKSTACGVLKFVCVMRMASEIRVVFKDLRLTMQGCAAPARLKAYTSANEEGIDSKANLPHSLDGAWAGPFSIIFETTFAELLKGPDVETLNFVVIDEMGMRQGEAVLPYRCFFSTKPDTVLPFKLSVTYSCRVETEGEEKLEPVGAVGELEGNILYAHLPVYAQMAGGINVDGEVQGGFLLIDGLPYPQNMEHAPPLWREEPTHSVLDSFTADLQPNEEHETNLDDLDDRTIFEALEQIDLPPPWEKRRERAGDRARVYFADPRSRKTTWKDPRFLPENWDQRIDALSGKVYYQYHKTRETTYVDPRGCPPGWDMRLSKNGEIYFAYIPAMKTTFIDPRGLPESIDAALDDLGRMYFKNHLERNTQWEDPRIDQQEVTLKKWRQGQAGKWLKERVLHEIEEQQKQRSDLDERHDERNDNDAVDT